MAIREKLKAKFGKTKKTSSGESTPSTVSVEKYYTGRTDIEYYKPHEIPKSKYGSRVDKAHQESLQSYSFGDAFQVIRRRTSMALSGTFSPGGSKALSAANSRLPSAAASRRTSFMSRNRSSVSSAGGSEPSFSMDDVPRRKSVVAAHPPAGDISENSDDDTDVANTGLSRTATAKPVPNIDGVSGQAPIIRLDREATITQKEPQRLGSPTHDIPFTPEELEKAMTKATLTANNSSSFRPRSIAVY